MRRALVTLFATFAICATAQNLKVPGLQQPVEVFRDQYGINHIYAQNEHDLFFAQGYCAAKDRLFQFELWRRQATGTTAELLGPREINRDIGVRLFKYRGDLDKEFNHYHPRGKQIITAFTDGINAQVREALKEPKKLPIEFKLLGTKPGLWTPGIVISRHQGLLGNIAEEVLTGRRVAAVGAKKAAQLDVFEPGNPLVEIDPSINQQRLSDQVIMFYDAFRKDLLFTPADLVAHANSDLSKFESLVIQDEADRDWMHTRSRNIIGSNNWIVSGTLSESGYPMLANDPHRALAAPSLRYMVHLSAPGWNVVGGGEPTIPGVSIGHNEYGAWGLTVFAIDGEDLYVYELNPQNLNQYRYDGKWESMTIIKDTIKVKGAPDVITEHHYTRHGPVTFYDPSHSLAYAVRCAWMEPGGAPYMASLRMDQAKDWTEFRDACSYSHIPGENMIWADRAGNIGWQAVGIAPVRKNWSGLVPVPGDGRYEWSGYLPIQSLPNVYNPPKGFWATANENLVPTDYAHKNAVGASWAETYRADRVNEVLGSGKKHSQQDMMRLQFDYLSIPARKLVPYLKDLKATSEQAETARKKLLGWNFVMDKHSIEATIYATWEKRLTTALVPRFVPKEGLVHYKDLPISRVIEWIEGPSPELGAEPAKARDALLIEALQAAVDSLTGTLGEDMSKWQYGQTSFHHVLIKHPLSNAADVATRKKLEVGPAPRGGYAYTPGMTGNSNNQTSGASYRIVVDTKDWDLSMFTNTPGQSGNPEHPLYRNLFDLWANDMHFPVYFTREKIEKSAGKKLVLTP